MNKIRTFKSRVLETKIKKLEAATIAVSWKGSAPPEEHPAIEAEYKKRRMELWNYVMEFII